MESIFEKCEILLSWNKKRNRKYEFINLDFQISWYLFHSKRVKKKKKKETVENIIRIDFLSELQSKERNKRKRDDKKKMNTKERETEQFV